MKKLLLSLALLTSFIHLSALPPAKKQRVQEPCTTPEVTLFVLRQKAETIERALDTLTQEIAHGMAHDFVDLKANCYLAKLNALKRKLTAVKKSLQ